MEFGEKIYQLRKMSGMTQEQFAEKLAVSRQTVSKWESSTSLPDLQSMIRICNLFELSLDDLCMEKKGEQALEEKENKITLQDLMEVNAHNRRRILLLTTGFLFIMVSILIFTYMHALEITTSSTQYMLYRYIVTGQYENAPVAYGRFMVPAVAAGIIGILLCLFYLLTNKDRRN